MKSFLRGLGVLFVMALLPAMAMAQDFDLGTIREGESFSSKKVTFGSCTQDDFTQLDVMGENGFPSGFSMGRPICYNGKIDANFSSSGTPSGDYTPEVQIGDGRGGGGTLYAGSFIVEANSAPNINSSPSTSGKEGSLYSYSVSASDADGDGLSYSKVSGPGWLSFSGRTLRGTPGYDAAGSHSVSILVTDGHGGSDTQSWTINVSNTNRNPSFSSSPNTNAKEGEDYEYNISASDPDGDSVSLSLREGPGWLSLSGNRLYGTPGYDQAGEHSVQIRASDGNGGTRNQSFTISVENTNRPPTITSSGDRTVNEGEAYSYDVQVTDADGDDVSFSLLEGPGWLSFSGNRLQGTPGYDQAGEHAIEIRVSDGNGGTDTQSFALTVRNTNLPPEITSIPVLDGAEAELYTYNITTTDPDGDNVSVSAGSIPGWLSLVDNGDGTATLEGTPGYSDSGSYSIELTASDGSLTDEQAFTITIENVNLPPEFTSTPIEEGKETETYTYQITTSDLEGDDVSISIQEGPEWLSLTDTDPASGTATLQGTPGYEDEGSYEIELQASDGELSQVQGFTLIIEHTNAAPEFTSTPVEQGKEAESYSYQVTGSDIDSFNNLSFSLTQGAEWLSLTDNGDGTATLEGTPGYSDSGSYSIELLIEDDGTPGKSDTQSFTLDIENTNRAPEITSTEVVAVEEGREYSYLIEGSDPDGDDLSFSGVEIPHWATFTDNGDGTALLEGTPGYSDSDVYSVEIQVEDSDGDNPLTGAQAFSIAVADINGYPEFTSTPIEEGKENEIYTYHLETSDPDGDAVTISVLEAPDWLSLLDIDPASGTATLQGTPDFEAEGRHRVEVRGTDSGNPTLNVEQAFYITIEGTNRGPGITSTAITEIRENETYSYLMESADPDGDDLSFSGVEIPHWATFTDNGDGTALLEGTPSFTDNGSYSVEVTVSDGDLEDAQTFTIEVEDVNDAPVFVSDAVTEGAENTTYQYEIEVTDADGDSIQITDIQIPNWMEFADNGDGTALLEGTPGYDDSGAYEITLSATDGVHSPEQRFVVNISNTNREPEFTSVPVTEGHEGAEYSYEITTTDPDGDDLNITAVRVPEWLEIQRLNPRTGIAFLTGTPGMEDSGDYDIELQVDDADLDNTQIFTITIANTNQAPLITSTSVTEGKESQLYSYEITTTDPDGDDLVFSGVEIPHWATFTDNGDGTALLEGTPGFEDSGDYEVEVGVADDEFTTSYSFTISVENTNREPQIISEAVKAVEANRNYTYEIQATDPDGDPVQLSIVDVPEWATFTDNGDGTAMMEGAPDFEDSGIYPIELIVEDAGSPSLRSSQNFDIVVSYTNRQPEFTSTSVTEGAETQEYSYEIQMEDVDNDNVTISIVEAPDWLSLVDIDPENRTATLEGTPGYEDSGVYRIEIEGTDNGNPSLSESQIFELDIQNTNRPPEIISTAVTDGVENTHYSYSIEVQELDSQDDVTITASGVPSWATFTDNGNGTALMEGTPSFTDNGSYSVELTASDGRLHDEQNFTIEIEDVNDAPVFVSDAVTEGAENSTYQYEIEVTDADNDDVTITANGVPEWATFTDNEDGTAMLEGTPGFEDSGNYPVELAVSDGDLEDSQAFTVEIEDVNRNPVYASAPLKDVKEGLSYTYSIEASDPDGDAVSISIKGKPHWATFTDNGDGTALLEGTPGMMDSGFYSVVLTATDNGVGALETEQKFSIFVANTNDPPYFISNEITQVQEEDQYRYEIEAGDNDGENVTISIIEAPDFLSLADVKPASRTATLIGTPGLEDDGEYTVRLMARDSGTPSLGAVQSYTLTVLNTNQDPLVTSTPVTGAAEAEEYSYLVQASDPDGDDLSFSGVEIPHWATFTDNGDGTALLEGIPDYKENGSYPVEITASDGVAENSQVFTIDVDITNHRPVIHSEPVWGVQAENQYSYRIQATDSIDALDDEVTFSALLQNGEALPEFLSLRSVSSPAKEFHIQLSGTPPAEKVGKYAVRVIAKDDDGATATQEFDIEVVGENRPPVFTTEGVENVNVDSLYSYTIQASDPDENRVSYSIVESADWLDFTDNGDGTALLEGTPSLAQAGEHTIIIKAVDDGSPEKHSIQEYTVQVGKNNKAPEIVSSSPNFSNSPELPDDEGSKGKQVANVKEELEYKHTIMAYDTTDRLEQELEVSVEAVEGLSFPGFLELKNIETNRAGVVHKELIGVPKSGDKGEYGYAIRATDEAGAFDQKVIEFIVEQGNRPPEFTSEPGDDVRIGQVYEYEITTSDPDDDNVSYSVELSGGKELPHWIEVTSTQDGTTLIKGIPDEADMGLYSFSITAVDDGSPVKSSVQEFEVEVKYKKVTELSILYNYPNPFSNETKIKFESPAAGDYYIELYNSVGALLRKTDKISGKEGLNEFSLEALDLASGVYIYRVITGNAVDTGRFTLIK